MYNSKPLRNEPELEGWLYKWTNYIKGGYRKRWFVLSKGVLSYYRNQTEMKDSLRKSLSLHNIIIHTVNSYRFVISHGGTTLHLKAPSRLQKAQWVMSLELAKMRAIRMMELDDDDFAVESTRTLNQNEIETVIEMLMTNLKDIKTNNELVSNHNENLQLLLETVMELSVSSPDLPTKLMLLKEQCDSYKTLSNDMTKACSAFADIAQDQGRKWQRFLKYQHEHSQHLEEMVEQLARQHSQLELAIEANSVHSLASKGKSLLSMDDEYFDAAASLSDLCNNDRWRTISSEDQSTSTSETGNDWPDGRISAKKSKKITFNDDNKSIVSFIRTDSLTSATSTVDGKRKRRTRIPERPNYKVNLWGIIKNFVGKDLTRIPFPVNFSEPLSLLQRLSEEFEYSELLDQAAQCKDSCEQLAIVAAYVISPYATTSVRSCKPFNPLLGETYECDRRSDLGWCSIAEQVNHHPPISAQYCEGRGWTYWQECSLQTKFRGITLQLIPVGITHLYFHETKNHYTWRKVMTTVHNIIVGKLWVEHHGEMEIFNHATGDKCHLNFLPYSYFKRDVFRTVTGEVFDKEGNIHWSLSGTWDNRIEGCKVFTKESDPTKKNFLQNSEPRVLWSRRWPPIENERMYNFTELTMQLNELEEGVATTDSRWRPDQRLMENQMWDEANEEKVRLEEKQRAVRRKREKEMEEATAEGREYPPYEPVWFKQELDPITGNLIHIYQGKYFEAKKKQDWSMCPDIF